MSKVKMKAPIYYHVVESVSLPLWFGIVLVTRTGVSRLARSQFKSWDKANEWGKSMCKRYNRLKRGE